MANPGTSLQIANDAILDIFGKQTYLGNAFLATTGIVSISSANSETPLMLLNNPSSNTNASANHENISLFQNVRKVQIPTIGNDCLLKFYLNPTVSSAGTNIPINNLRTGSSNTTHMTASKSPSVSANGTFIGSLYGVYASIDSTVLFIMDPGSTLYVTATCTDSSTNVICELPYYER